MSEQSPEVTQGFTPVEGLSVRVLSQEIQSLGSSSVTPEPNSGFPVEGHVLEVVEQGSEVFSEPTPGHLFQVRDELSGQVINWSGVKLVVAQNLEAQQTLNLEATPAQTGEEISVVLEESVPVADISGQENS